MIVPDKVGIYNRFVTFDANEARLASPMGDVCSLSVVIRVIREMRSDIEIVGLHNDFLGTLIKMSQTLDGPGLASFIYVRQ